MKTKLILAASFAALLATTSVARAQENAPLRHVSVLGEASQMVAPDQALISFTIESRDASLQGVKEMQDTKLKKLYLLAGEQQIAKRDLRTQYARLQPDYQYHNGKRNFVGYVASVNVQLTLDEMEKAARVMQALVDAQFDRVNNIQYRVKDEQPIREELKIQALQNAKAKAGKMAQALGMALGKPIHIAEAGAAQPSPVPMMRSAKLESAVASVAPQAPPAGEQEIRQTMSVSFEMINSDSADAQR